MITGETNIECSSVHHGLEAPGLGRGLSLTKTSLTYPGTLPEDSKNPVRKKKEGQKMTRLGRSIQKTEWIRNHDFTTVIPKPRGTHAHQSRPVSKMPRFHQSKPDQFRHRRDMWLIGNTIHLHWLKSLYRSELYSTIVHFSLEHIYIFFFYTSQE